MALIAAQVIERRIKDLEREAVFLRAHLTSGALWLMHEAKAAEHALAEAYRKAMDHSIPHAEEPTIMIAKDSKFLKSITVKSDPAFAPGDDRKKEDDGE